MCSFTEESKKGTAPFDVESIRADFPILSATVNGRPLAYLDNGATAQKPLPVIEATDRIYREHNSNIHRGAHHLSNVVTTLYEEARERVRSYIGAADTAEIIFTSGATASINLVAATYGDMTVKKGDEVIITYMEHHADIVPWQMLCARKGARLRAVPLTPDGRLDMEAYEAMLSDRTRIVAVTQASNVLGTLPDLPRIIEAAHKAGARVSVDGCQGIVHGGVDVRALDCDFYAFSGHKLYGPTGIGVLYGKRELLEAMPPYMGGGDMVDKVTIEKTTYAQLPLKFEAGTTNYIGAIGLGEAIHYLRGIDMTAAWEHERALTRHAVESLSQVEGLTIYGPEERCSIVSFNVEGIHHMDMGMILDKMGVAVRTGTHCAQPLMAHYGVTGMVRASMAFYNTRNEIDRLREAVDRAVTMLR
ncbi:MAG: cysteine desulfurase [Rikenellaceae bacterium]|nr:cysteine desulfurase [Rikenellaceae bacterium]